MAITSIPEDTSGKVKRNAEIAVKSISTYVVLIASCAAAYWLSKSPEAQQAFLLAHPVLAPAAPYAAFIAFVLAKIAPQNLNLSGDRVAKMEQLFDYLAERVKAVQEGSAPATVLIPPQAMTAGLKPTDVASVAAAVTAKTSPPKVYTYEDLHPEFQETEVAQHVDLPIAPAPTPAAVVEANLAAVARPADPMAAIRPIFAGKTDDEIRAMVAATAAT